MGQIGQSWPLSKGVSLCEGGGGPNWVKLALSGLSYTVPQSEGGIGPNWAKLALSKGGFGAILSIWTLSKGGSGPVRWICGQSLPKPRVLQRKMVDKWATWTLRSF